MYEDTWTCDISLWRSLWLFCCRNSLHSSGISISRWWKLVARIFSHSATRALMMSNQWLKIKMDDTSPPPPTAPKWNITGAAILCCLRHLEPESVQVWLWGGAVVLSSCQYTHICLSCWWWHLPLFLYHQITNYYPKQINTSTYISVIRTTTTALMF